jgi:hypothetical protein
MAWEKRKHSKTLVYTRTERVGKRRRRVYFGTGPIADLAATVDELNQIERELARRERAKQNEEGAPAPRPFEQ